MNVRSQLEGLAAQGRQFQFEHVNSSHTIGTWRRTEGDERPLRSIGKQDLTPNYDGCTLKPVVDDTGFGTGGRGRADVVGQIAARRGRSQKSGA